jgi:hypothetical protein
MARLRAIETADILKKDEEEMRKHRGNMEERSKSLQLESKEGLRMDRVNWSSTK